MSNHEKRQEDSDNGSNFYRIFASCLEESRKTRSGIVARKRRDEIGVGGKLRKEGAKFGQETQEQVEAREKRDEMGAEFDSNLGKQDGERTQLGPLVGQLRQILEPIFKPILDNNLGNDGARNSKETQGQIITRERREEMGTKFDAILGKQDGRHNQETQRQVKSIQKRDKTGAKSYDNSGNGPQINTFNGDPPTQFKKCVNTAVQDFSGRYVTVGPPDFVDIVLKCWSNSLQAFPPPSLCTRSAGKEGPSDVQEYLCS